MSGSFRRLLRNLRKEADRDAQIRKDTRRAVLKDLWKWFAERQAAVPGSALAKVYGDFADWLRAKEKA